MEKIYKKLLLTSSIIKVFYANLFALELEGRVDSKEYEAIITNLIAIRKMESDALNKIYLQQDNRETILKELLKKIPIKDKITNNIYRRLEDVINTYYIESYNKIFIENMEKAEENKGNRSDHDINLFVNSYLKSVINSSIETSFIYFLNESIGRVEQDVRETLINEKYQIFFLNKSIEKEMVLNYFRQDKQLYVYANHIELNNFKAMLFESIKKAIIVDKLNGLLDELYSADIYSKNYKAKIEIISVYIRSLSTVYDVTEILKTKNESNNIVANSIINSIIILIDQDKNKTTKNPPKYKYPKNK